MHRSTALPAVLLAMAIFLTACDGGKSKESATGGAAEKSATPAGPLAGAKARDHVAEARETDKHVEEVLADKGAKHAEAKAWLKVETHGAFKQNKAEMTKLIEAIYAAGAPDVQAADIVVAGSSELCDMFIVTMPSDKKARQAVLEVANPFFTGNGEEPGDAVVDVGQKYLELMTD